MKKIFILLVIAAIGLVSVNALIDMIRQSTGLFDTHVTVTTADGGALHVSIKREEIDDSNHFSTHLRYLHTLSYQASATAPLEKIGQMHGRDEVQYCIKRWDKLLVISHPNFACKDQKIEGDMGDSATSVSEVYPAVFVRTPDGIWRNHLLTVRAKPPTVPDSTNDQSLANKNNAELTHQNDTIFPYTMLPSDVVQQIWHSIDTVEHETAGINFKPQYEDMRLIAIDDERHQLIYSHGGANLGYERWLFFKLEADGTVSLAKIKNQGIACHSHARAKRCSVDSAIEHYPGDKPLNKHQGADSGNSPLHRACSTSDQDSQYLMDALIKDGANPTSINALGLHPLDLCLLQGDRIKIKKLLDYVLIGKFATQSVHPRNGSLLHIICKSGDLDQLTRAMRQVTDITARDFEGQSALDQCLARRQEKADAVEMVDALLDHPMLKNETSRHQQSELWEHACNFRDAKLAIMLKKRQLKLPDNLQLQQQLIRRCLDDAGSDAISEELIPELAATGFNFNILCCRDLNDKNSYRESILHIAAREARMPNMLGVMIAAGADVMVKDKHGLLPFDTCLRTRCDGRKMFAIVRAMTSRLSNIDSIRIIDDKQTLLYALVSMDTQYVDSIKLLLKHGANPDFPVTMQSGYISTPRNVAAARDPHGEAAIALSQSPSH